MINTEVYDYINVLDKAADASALRNRIIGNNISNADTPGYKRQDVAFEEDLRRALKNSRYETLDDKVESVRLDRLNGTVYTDHANYSYRTDRNNVDIDNENVELASNQLKYNGLVQSMTEEFSRLRTAMANNS